MAGNEWSLVKSWDGIFEHAVSATRAGRPTAGGQAQPSHSDKATPETRLTVSRHKRHAQCHQAPAQQRHLLQLRLRKVPTVPQHVGLDRQSLDHVEVAPPDVVADNHGRFTLGNLVPGNDNVGPIQTLENELNPHPAGPGDVAGEAVGKERVDGPQDEEQREEDVLCQEDESPRGHEGNTPEIRPEVGVGAGHGGYGQVRL